MKSNAAAARAAAHPIPDAVIERAHPMPDGRLLYAHLLDYDIDGANHMRAGDVLVADLNRPGLERPGAYLAVWPLGGSDVAVIPGYIPAPFTKRGTLRRSFVFGGVRFLAEEHGRVWWAFRCCQHMRFEDVDTAA